MRFDIEENFLDDKFNGFQLEASLLRSAEALTRLCGVLAVALFLVCQGVEVVQAGRRRWIDAHWFRGQSYLKICWHWVRAALIKGYELIQRFHLPSTPDPEPAKASQKQTKPIRHNFRVRYPGPLPNNLCPL